MHMFLPVSDTRPRQPTATHKCDRLHRRSCATLQTTHTHRVGDTHTALLTRRAARHHRHVHRRLATQHAQLLGLLLQHAQHARRALALGQRRQLHQLLREVVLGAGGAPLASRRSLRSSGCGSRSAPSGIRLLRTASSKARVRRLLSGPPDTPSRSRRSSPPPPPPDTHRPSYLWGTSNGPQCCTTALHRTSDHPQPLTPAPASK